MRVDKETERKIDRVLEGSPEPWDHVNKVTAVMAGGEVLAVVESMDNGDCILSIGEGLE